MACEIYISIAFDLLQAIDPQAAYLQGVLDAQKIYSQSLYAQKRHHFQGFNSGELANLPMDFATRLEAAIYN